MDADETRSSAGNSIPNGFLAAYQQGLDLRRVGDDKAALAAFSESLSVKDATLRQAAGPLREVAEIYLEEGRPAEALSLARIATGIEEDNPAYLNTLARVLLGQDDRGEDDLEEALAAVKRGLEISRDNPELLHIQALISEAKGDLQQAISIMERAAAQNAKFEEDLQALKARHE
jgi:tetratricopeptide (TPR) repeat protein